MQTVFGLIGQHGFKYPTDESYPVANSGFQDSLADILVPGSLCRTEAAEMQAALAMADEAESVAQDGDNVVGPGEKAQPQKGPAPNLGANPPHGGPEHEAAIREKEAEVKALGATNIRINQVQVDINGDRVGDNRPDLQYDLDGVHHNWEVDRDPARSAAHGVRITANDPQATCTLTMLGDC